MLASASSRVLAEMNKIKCRSVKYYLSAAGKRDEHPNGIQLKAIKEHLNDRGNIKYVWYDRVHAPERTPEETARFRLMSRTCT